MVFVAQKINFASHFDVNLIASVGCGPFDDEWLNFREVSGRAVLFEFFLWSPVTARFRRLM